MRRTLLPLSPGIVLLFGTRLLGAQPQAGALPVGTSPVSVAIDARANLAFVANKGSQDISVIDLASRTVTGRYQVGGVPESVAVHPSTGMVVVTNLQGLVHLIDQGQGKIVASLPAGRSPSRVAIDPASNTAWVTNFNGSGATVIDLGSRRVTGTVALPNGPLGIAILEGMRRAVVAAQYDMEVVLLDLEKREVVARTAMGRYVGEVAFDPKSGMVLVGNPSSNGVLASYNPIANRVVGTLPVGAGPLSLAVYPKRSVLAVSACNAGTVSLVAMDLSRVICSVSAGKGPSGIAVHPESGVAVVANRLDGTVSFLELNGLLEKEAR